jgi:hypothetical protein
MSSVTNNSSIEKSDESQFFTKVNSNEHKLNKVNSSEGKKGERYKVLHVDKTFAAMIDFVKLHKRQIAEHSVVLETIKGLGMLGIVPLNWDTLVNDVHRFTNMEIHEVNYTKLTDFQRIVVEFTANLRNLYASAITDQDRIRLFNHGLSAKGCFEERLEALTQHYLNSQTVVGQIRMEMMDWNLSQGNSRYEPISFQNLISQLVKNNFFKKNLVDQNTFKDHPAVADLIDRGFINSSLEKSTLAKIEEALSLYEHHGSGKKTFTKYLLALSSFSMQEKEHIEKSIEEYIRSNPEKGKWI